MPLTPEGALRRTTQLLEDPSLELPGLKTDAIYHRLHDKNKGDRKRGEVVVSVTKNGNVLLSTYGHDGGLLEFSSEKSPRVRNALMIMAYAIKKDNEADGVPKDYTGGG